MQIKLQQSIDMEKNNLGIAYTAFSRCESERNWCLVEPLTQDRLMYINRHPRMKARQDEENKFKTLSQKTVAKYDITIAKYLNLLQEFHSFCDDGIEDAVCTNTLHICTRASCQSH